MLDKIGPSAVNLEPGERFSKRTAVDEGAFRARADAEIMEPALKGDHVSESFDVAAGEGQIAQSRSGLAARPPASHTGGIRGLFVGDWFLSIMCTAEVFSSARAGGQPERDEQTAEQQGVGEDLGCGFESTPMRVDGRERPPQRFGGAVMQLG
jgi:hypothetical protein